MSKRLVFSAPLLFGVSLGFLSASAAQAQAGQAKPTLIREVKHDDTVARQLTVPLSGVSTGLNFDGQSADDNRNLLGFAFVPPDTNGAVGATQFVQIVNVTYAVYDKKTGALVLGPALIHTASGRVSAGRAKKLGTVATRWCSTISWPAGG